MTKILFVIACTFLFIIGHTLTRKKQMQKSLVWRGFLSESMWVDDYGNLSLFKKLVFWVNYPFSYAKYLWVVVWDLIDRLSFRDSRARSLKQGWNTKNPVKYNNGLIPKLKNYFFES